MIGMATVSSVHSVHSVNSVNSLNRCNRCKKMQKLENCHKTDKNLTNLDDNWPVRRQTVEGNLFREVPDPKKSKKGQILALVLTYLWPWWAIFWSLTFAAANNTFKTVAIGPLAWATSAEPGGTPRVTASRTGSRSCSSTSIPCCIFY